ncbi:MAG TPA: hypothetical protein VKB37_18290, partial [Jatrophihabitantaceae bacterium]|nr:hypothetical protein [Jatrophihabitantaceae bacterium]
MRKSAIGLVVAGVAASLVLSACSSSKKSSSNTSTPAGGATSPASTPATSSSAAAGAIDGKGAKVGIIWPDTQSSNRWITSDPDAAKAECQKVNLNCIMQNANNSADQMTTDAQNMINQGVKVLLIVNLDSASAA